MRKCLLPLGVTMAMLIAPQLNAQEKVWPASAEQVDFRALQSLPDWRGIWTPLRREFPPTQPPQLKGKYKDHYDEIQALIKKGDPESLLKVERRGSACEPPGLPGVMNSYNVEFLFTPGRVTVLQEAYMQVRRIYTDGRPLPDDPDPTFNGHSIGTWDGDTLVITTVGLRDGQVIGRYGITSSEKIKVTERIHLDPNNKDRMIVNYTFEDPDALAAPWQSVYVLQRHRHLDQIEFICAQNDRNPINEDGEVEFLDAAN